MEPAHISTAEECGEALADSVMEAAHMTYNARRGKKMITVCQKILSERLNKFQAAGESMLRLEPEENEDRKILRSEKSGIRLANYALTVVHMPGVTPSSIGEAIETCIRILDERFGEIKEVPAKPAYKKARYEKNKK